MYQNITDISQVWPGITPFNVWDLPYDMWLLFTRKLEMIKEAHSNGG